jgi:hypothetical protein
MRTIRAPGQENAMNGIDQHTMPKQDDKAHPNKAEHQRRAAEALRENLRRRKEQQRKQAPTPGPEEKDDPA